MKTNFLLRFVLFAGLLLNASCDDLFREKPIDRLPEDMIWESPQLLDGYVLPWYRNMSNGFSVYMPYSNETFKLLSREFLPWFGDQITVSKSDWFNTRYGDILKSDKMGITSKGLSYWTNYYEQIRSINLLLENADRIPEGARKDRVLGEAYFFRAYYYYLLLRQFGGPVLLKEVYDPLKNQRKYPRASYEEMVEFIAGDAERAATYLPESYDAENTGRATKGAAIMLKAKTYFWAASTHFQNQAKDYLGFPDNRSDAMLTKAKVAYDELMKLPYDLIQIDGTSRDQIVDGYRQIFLTKNSKESIWEVQHSNDGDFANGFGHKLDRESSSPYYGGTTAAYTPTQNHVDEYGMQQGKVYDANHPYENRDFRFYANILYDGCQFRGREMEIHYTVVNGEEVAGADLTPYGASETAAVTRTGYYLGKFVDPGQQINTNDTYGSKQNYIIWRFAEVLLDYAEIDFMQGRTGDALEKINRIRRRAHIYELDDITWDAIVNERRVEMAFEETTFWDLLRYDVAVEKMSGASNPLKAMKIVKADGMPASYTVSNMNSRPSRIRIFRSMQYYYPIPWAEVDFQGIEQNPEWTRP